MMTRRSRAEAPDLLDDVYPEAPRECREGIGSSRSLGLMREPVTAVSTWRVPSFAAKQSEVGATSAPLVCAMGNKNQITHVDEQPCRCHPRSYAATWALPRATMPFGAPTPFSPSSLLLAKAPPWGSRPQPQGEEPCAAPTELGGSNYDHNHDHDRPPPPPIQISFVFLFTNPNRTGDMPQ